MREIFLLSAYLFRTSSSSASCRDSCEQLEQKFLWFCSMVTKFAMNLNLQLLNFLVILNQNFAMLKFAMYSIFNDTRFQSTSSNQQTLLLMAAATIDDVTKDCKLYDRYDNNNQRSAFNANSRRSDSRLGTTTLSESSMGYLFT